MQFRINTDIRGSFDLRVDVDSGVASVSDLKFKLEFQAFSIQVPGQWPVQLRSWDEFLWRI